MSPLSAPWFVIAIVVVAMATSFVVMRFLPRLVSDSTRYETIDGLRGFLALGVFASHSTAWYLLLTTGKWSNPALNPYVDLAECSVLLFFMITAFLFSGKLLDSRGKRVSWVRLYTSRAFRLCPLYVAAMLVVFCTVAVATDFTLRGSLLNLSEGATKWLFFRLAGAPNLNGFPDTSLITAGVTWTLCYEWLFYSALPLLALLLGPRPPWRIVIASLIVTGGVVLLMAYPNPKIVAAFGGGVLAALVAGAPVSLVWFRSRIAGALAMALCALAVARPGLGFHLPVALPLTGAFVIVACGNNIFGVLTSRGAKFLGDISYGLYLLHGLILFIGFRSWQWLTGSPDPGFAGWLVLGLTVVVVLVSFWCYRFIERPAMARVPHASNWVGARLDAIHAILMRSREPA
jgi:peptidoglycan/LPS O-acetylase OafA/YrhL